MTDLQRLDKNKQKTKKSNFRSHWLSCPLHLAHSPMVSSRSYCAVEWAIKTLQVQSYASQAGKVVPFFHLIDLSYFEKELWKQSIP